MTRTAVAAPNQASVAAATAVAEAGGSAVDAALAATAVTMSTEPGMVSLAGGMYVAVWPGDGDPEVIDANVEMPGRGQPADRFGSGLMEFRTSYGGGLTLFAGPGSVATPGALAGMGLAHDRHGRVSWAEVLAPAIAVCEDGYPIGAASATYLGLTGSSVYGWDPETLRQVVGADGGIVRLGEVCRNPELAGTWRHLATAGWQDGYTGHLAAALADDQGHRGGLITRADLAAYRAVLRAPVLTTAGDWRIALNPPPSIGGPMLAVMLAELVRRGPDLAGIIDIQRRVLGYRFAVHDLSADLEGDGYDLLERVERHGLASLPTSSSTAHVSVVDETGTACAVTFSSGYGSGATIPGTGVMLNNCLGEPELNRLGLHALAPGTRLASNMAPTTARSATGHALAIGSPGADRITTALMQVLGRYCLDGVTLAEAIDAPRLHVRILPDGTPQVDHERALSAAAAASGLACFDHGARSMFFGGVAAAQRSPDGTLLAAGDPRRETAVAVG